MLQNLIASTLLIGTLASPFSLVQNTSQQLTNKIQNIAITHNMYTNQIKATTHDLQKLIDNTKSAKTEGELVEIKHKLLLVENKLTSISNSYESMLGKNVKDILNIINISQIK
ncbi:MAG: hypothetical protein ACRCX2_09935 [Paraclostridium sp.]